MVITYEVAKHAEGPKYLYLNITNRCNNDCTFCLRRERKSDNSEMDRLWLDREPDVDEILDDIFSHDLSEYKELVFCGYGEPTMRFKDILEICDAVKAKSDIRIRLNTNGLADIVYGTDTTPWLEGRIDAVSVSLNAPDSESYEKICHPLVPNAFDAMLAFTAHAGEYVDTIMTVVDFLPKEQIAECSKIASDLGAEFKIRNYLE